MKNFSYARADDQQSALSLLSQGANIKFLGGGTNLIDLMRENIEQPDALIDITRVPLTAIEELPDGGLRIGALVRNSHLASNKLVRTLSDALAGDSNGCFRSIAQHGNDGRQSDAANALLLLLRRRGSLQ